MSDRNERFTTVNVSTITILKVVGIALLLWFLFTIRDILFLILISFIISAVIDPLAEYLQKKHIPRGISVFMVYILFIGIVAMTITLLVPPIVEQFKALSESNFYDSFVDRVGGVRENLHRYGIDETVTENFEQFASSVSQGLLNTTRGIFSGFLSVITVLVISFYLSAEENGTKHFVKRLVPFKSQPYANRLVNKIQRKIGQWVLGQVLLCFSIFALTYAGLLILKVDYALVLALIAGLLEIIPYIGPIISVIPAAFFAFLQHPPLVLAVLILYIIVQQLENHLLVPMIMSKSTGLNPIFVIIGILIGGGLGGWVGAIIAVPILSGIQVFIDDFVNSEELQEIEDELEA